MGSIIRINKGLRRFYIEGLQTGKEKHRVEIQICNIKQLLYFPAIIGQKILIAGDLMSVLSFICDY